MRLHTMFALPSQDWARKCVWQDLGKNGSSQASLPVFQLSRFTPWILNNITFPFVSLGNYSYPCTKYLLDQLEPYIWGNLHSLQMNVKLQACLHGNSVSDTFTQTYSRSLAYSILSCLKHMMVTQWSREILWIDKNLHVIN